MKYYSHKAEYHGMTFDSRQEMQRYIELRCREQRGEVSQIHRQVRFCIIPQQKGWRIRHLKTKTREELYEVERPAYYTADFVYRERGRIIIEDVKSPYTARLKDYVLRRKLMVRTIRQKNERWHETGALYVVPPGRSLFVFREAEVKKNKTIIKDR